MFCVLYYVFAAYIEVLTLYFEVKLLCIMADIPQLPIDLQGEQLSNLLLRRGMAQRFLQKLLVNPETLLYFRCTKYPFGTYYGYCCSVELIDGEVYSVYF